MANSIKNNEMTKDMNVLAIDTSTETLGISLATRDHTVFNLSLAKGFLHAGSLVPWIEKMCVSAECKPSQIDLIICSIGPGSFTGLRIGLSTAKGIALGAGCPVIGIPSLDAIAFGLSCFQGVVVPVVDARKKRFYAGFYRNGMRVADYGDITMEDLVARSLEFPRVLFAGPGAGNVFHALPEEVRGEQCILYPGYSVINPFFLLQAGIQRFEREKKGDPDSAGPLYLRKSEAELNRKK